MIINPNSKVQVSTFFVGGDGDYNGYYFAEYFPGLDLEKEFASKEEAQQELEAAYLGPDCYGVGVTWDISE